MWKQRRSQQLQQVWPLDFYPMITLHVENLSSINGTERYKLNSTYKVPIQCQGVFSALATGKLNESTSFGGRDLHVDELTEGCECASQSFLVYVRIQSANKYLPFVILH